MHEQQVYGDLVVIKFQEGYYRLTAKTLRMLEWFLQFYKGTEDRPKFLVKTDHDVFVNVPNLLRHMYSSETWTSMRQNGYYFGELVRVSHYRYTIFCQFFRDLPPPSTPSYLFVLHLYISRIIHSLQGDTL